MSDRRLAVIEKHLQQALRMNLEAPSVRARGRRVLLLMGLVTILSIGDLIVTLTFLRSTGMVELNPLAAFVIRNQSVAGLIFFKIGSVLMSVSILTMIRHTRRGEIAAWVAASILVALTFHWSEYTDGANAFASTRFLEMTEEMDEWLRLGGTPTPTEHNGAHDPVLPVANSTGHAPGPVPGSAQSMADGSTVAGD